ncbi:MAG: ABC transporter substrate-binding protein [Candidatus Binataceae bacterium]
MNLRRRLLAFLAFAPAAAWAQPAAGVHRIGVLSGGGRPNAKESRDWSAFFAAMGELGYEEGRNVVYEFRQAEGVPARFPQLARELIAAGVHLIVLTGSAEAVAAFRVTATIPIVAIHVGDPVELGVAVSLARPGRNLTGSTFNIPGFSAKALELLIEAFPNARRIGVLANPTQPNYRDFRQELERVAAHKGVMLLPTSEATRPEELESAFERVAKDKAQAIVVLLSALFLIHRQRVIAFAAQARVPTMYSSAGDVEAGGLMAYAVEFPTLYARAPVFVDKILKGEKPADIPIERPTRFGLWINLKTAKVLGITIPGSILLRAERVIE